MAFEPTQPSSNNLCGTFTDPTTRDPARDFSAPIVPSCEAPTDEIDEDVDVVFVDGEPVFGEAGVDAGTGLSYPDMPYVGELTDEEIFGGFQAPAACQVLGIQLLCQTPAEGADIQVCLVDDADAEIAGTTATLSANEPFEYTEFDDPIPLVTGDLVRAKVKQVGSEVPGGYLTCRLVIGPAA